MLGLMQRWPLTLDKIIDHARTWHGHREIVTRTAAGPIRRTTYADLHARAKRCSNALLAHGIVPGDRVATLAFNSSRHMECWYGIMGIGAVCHTLNPRLPPEQLVYIIEHAADRVLLADPACLAVLAAVLPACRGIERIVLLTDHLPAGCNLDAVVYESWIAPHCTDCVWGDFDEESAAGLCYTSGTTGDPKGVLYSHRSNFLHTLMTLQPDVMGLSTRDVIMPIVPMFHANAWGLAFAAPAVGAKLVMPGPRLDPASLFELLESERVTFSGGVPTVWQMLLQYLEKEGRTLSSLKRAFIGGSACPESLIRAFGDRHGVEMVHAWGMTEASPVGTVCTLTPDSDGLTADELIRRRLKQGRAACGVQLKLTDDAGVPVPFDGRSFGRLKIRGPAIAGSYFRRESENVLDPEGFFDTGDVATIDAQGYLQITDRTKDVIKSGGEWISSIFIENIAVGHPSTAAAAVIAVPDAKWGERPLLIVELKPGMSATEAELLTFLAGKLTSWWMPERVMFLDRIPLGATGKIDKKALRHLVAAKQT